MKLLAFPRASSSSRTSTRFHLRLAIFAGALLCVSPALSAQSVSFAGATPSVNFGTANLCAADQTTPAPCSVTMTLDYKVTASGTLGPIQVLAGRAPSAEFTLESGSTCTGTVSAGTTCTVKVTFAPEFAGQRAAAVLITDGSGAVLATTPIYGYGVGSKIGIVDSAGFSIGGFYGNIAADGLGNVYLSFPDFDGDGAPVDGSVVEKPANGGPQITVYTSTTNYPGGGLGVDASGNLFFGLGVDSEDGRVQITQFVELPAGGGALKTLPFSVEPDESLLGVDAGGDLFFEYINSNNQLVEITKAPAECESSACLTTVIPSVPANASVTLDFAGNLYVSQYAAIDGLESLVSVSELPAGGGPQITLLSGSQLYPYSFAGADGLGNLYFSLTYQTPFPENYNVAELPAGSYTLVPYLAGIFGSPILVDPLGDIVTFWYYPSDNYALSEYPRAQAAPLVSFGATVTGGTASQWVPVANTGNRTLSATASINNPSYEIVNMAPNNCLAAIAPSEICQIQIGFSPSGAGADDGLLMLETNGSTNLTVPLQGSGGGGLAFSVPSGVYDSAQTVSITGGSSYGTYYTTDGSTPIANKSPQYSGPITVSSTERLTALSMAGNGTNQIATAAYTILPATSPANVINLNKGFSGSQSTIQANGSAGVKGTGLQLTSGGEFQAGSAFYKTPLNAASFSTYFTFQLSQPIADGITFTIQNGKPTSLGSFGGGLGYAGIGRSVAIKFDSHNNAGEGPDSTALYTEGQMPTAPAISLTGTGIDLHSGDIFLAEIAYDGAALHLNLTDTKTLAKWSHSFAIDIPTTVGGDTAYFGFTGGTGTDSANQEILNWTYVAGAPGAAVPTSSTVFNFQNGFSGVGLVSNGSASLSASALQLTDGGPFEAASAYYSAPVNIQYFTTNFTFQLIDPAADGFTFVIQNAGLNALGQFGEGLGYGGIGKSVAVKFDLYNNAGEGPNSTGIFTDGALPTVPAIDLTNSYSYPGGLTLHSGYPFNATLTYDGKGLSLTVTDLVTGISFSQGSPIPIDIPATVGGDTAYVGFTAGTGEQTAVQDIFAWTFTNP